MKRNWKEIVYLDKIVIILFCLEKSAEVETSPRRSILPLLGKKSTSVDVNTTNAQDSSPPSDPWRFLSDIKVSPRLLIDVNK